MIFGRKRIDPVSLFDSRALTAFRDVVGSNHALETDDMMAAYTTDWTGRFQGQSPLVLRPANTSEVSAIVRIAHEADIPLVPQGGNTGLVGGSVPLRGEVVISIARLNQIAPVDVLAQQLTVGAGATLSKVQKHASNVGLEVGVDLAARDSCTIGGMIATNAGGINVIRYGSMRDQLLGIEAVLADGSVISHLEGLEKDNTGYNLSGLLAGSEGTLAILTQARIRLHPTPGNRCVAMVAFPSVADAVEATAALRRSLPDLHAIEVIFRNAMLLVSDHIGVSIPAGTAAEAWLLLEVAGQGDSTESLGNAIQGLKSPVIDVAVAEDTATQRNLWEFREKITEAIATQGTPHKLDVTLAASRLAQFVEGVPKIVSDIDEKATTLMFGHLGDGNVHVNILGGNASKVDSSIDIAVLAYTASLGGSISAEHGIGTAKRDLLHLNRSTSELAVFRSIKQALDPTNILNPNALIPEENL